jgi:putative oxidoreductase
MIFRHVGYLLPISLLLLRLLVSAVFISSGWSHASQPAKRAESIGMSKRFTFFLGIAELCGGLALVFGIWPQLAAAGLILIMLGAIYKKIAVWHTGFWGEKASGWHYELIFVLVNLVIIATNGGRFVITS